MFQNGLNLQSIDNIERKIIMTKKLNVKKAIVFAIIVAYIIIAPIYFIMSINDPMPMNNVWDNAGALLWVLSVTAVYTEVQNNRH